MSFIICMCLSKYSPDPLLNIVILFIRVKNPVLRKRLANWGATNIIK